MESNSQVVSEQKAGLFHFLMKLIKCPFTFAKVVLQYLMPKIFAKDLNNCLPGKVVLITGASSGLGEALAKTFYLAGCKVVLAARRLDELERVRDCLRQIKTEYRCHNPVVVQMDVSDLNSLPDKVRDILNIHGHIDILVNNAGMSLRSEVVNTDMKVDIQIMLVNYFGAVALTKAVLPSMISRKQGQILLISSMQGKFGIPERSSYGASKHALQAFSETLRAEVAQHNVKVTIVSPGYVKTNFSLNAVTGSGESYGKMDESTAAGDDPLDLSKEILQRLLRNENDVVLCGFVPMAAYRIHKFCPSLFFWIMERRARKLASKQKST